MTTLFLILMWVAPAALAEHDPILRPTASPLPEWNPSGVKRPEWLVSALPPAWECFFNYSTTNKTFVRCEVEGETVFLDVPQVIVQKRHYSMTACGKNPASNSQEGARAALEDEARSSAEYLCRNSWIHRQPNPKVINEKKVNVRVFRPYQLDNGREVPIQSYCHDMRKEPWKYSVVGE